MSGTLFIVGIGPGDPELMTLKAARLISQAPVVAYFAKHGRCGHARSIASGVIPASAELLRLEYPYTTEIEVADPAYAAGIAPFYDACADRIGARLLDGKNVALLCEGDPFFYGSSMYLFDRLTVLFPTEIVPGVTGMSGCWTRARLPMTHGDDVLTVLPGTLDADTLARRLAGSEAAVIMKVGRNFSKIRDALERSGRADRAVCVERGTMEGERIVAVADVGCGKMPYFSLVLVPGRAGAR